MKKALIMLIKSTKSRLFVKGGQKRYFGEFLYGLEPLCVIVL